MALRRVKTAVAVPSPRASTRVVVAAKAGTRARRRAAERLGTLPGVISTRIVAGASGAVEEIHILTNTEVSPKQTVRNVESALIAHLGMRVSHKKISVATSDESPRSARISQPTLA